MDCVLPYYLLKEQHQKLGFEGENLENQKRIVIICNSQAITMNDIKYHGDDHTDDVYLVRAASQHDHWYKVDILAYTCICSDYPVIHFCKHLHAIQTLFPLSDLASSAQLDNLSTGSEVQAPTASKENVGFGLSLGAKDSAPALSVGSGLDASTDSTSAVLCSVAKKLERFTARFRLNGTLEQARWLDAWIDHELSLDATRLSLLPVKQKLSPHLNSWPETQAAMMPAKKTHPKRAGDQAYGAGESSGKKAKLLPKPAVATESFPPAVVNTHPNHVREQVPQTNDPCIDPSHPPSTSNYYRAKTHLY